MIENARRDTENIADTSKQKQDVTEIKLVNIFMIQQPMIIRRKKENQMIKKTNRIISLNVTPVISSATEQQH